MSKGRGRPPLREWTRTRRKQLAPLLRELYKDIFKLRHEDFEKLFGITKDESQIRRILTGNAPIPDEMILWFVRNLDTLDEEKRTRASNLLVDINAELVQTIALVEYEETADSIQRKIEHVQRMQPEHERMARDLDYLDRGEPIPVPTQPVTDDHGPFVVPVIEGDEGASDTAQTQGEPGDQSPPEDSLDEFRATYNAILTLRGTNP